MPGTARGRWFAAFVAVALAVLVLVWTGVAAAREVYIRVRVTAVVNPVKLRHIEHALERARKEQARFVLLSLDTPGGLVSSTQDIITLITNAPVPVVGFVEPRSAQATSAGAFLLLATDVAVMAPGTRVGAAHPVGNGKKLEDTLDAKVTNSLVTLAKSLAERRGRPPKLAEAMVRDSVSFSAEDALREHLIEHIAVNDAELLQKLNGMRLRPSAAPLSTRGLQRIDVELRTIDRVLDVIAEPTIVSLFLTLGVLAIMYELASPGIGAGGAIGAILLILGLFGSSVLPVQITAVVLIAVGLAAIALEVKLQTLGVLGVGGLLALVLGGLLLIDPNEVFGGLSAVDFRIFAPLVVAAGVGLWFLARAARRALRAPPQLGPETFVGRTAIAKTAFTVSGSEHAGQVFLDGARYQALSSTDSILPDDPVVVVEVLKQPLRLRVRPLNEGGT